MGKVLSDFDLGWPGAISRSVDDVVVSLKNAGTEPILFGRPVFLTDDGGGVEGFHSTGSGGTPQTFDRFVGFAVRSASKTPGTYPDMQDITTRAGYQAGTWNPGEVVEVLVRGSIAVRAVTGFNPGGLVYIRKSDGSVVPGPGAEGSTLLLENVRCKVPQRGSGVCSEMVITSRNIQ